MGQILTFKNSSKDHFEFLKQKLETKLTNLDSAPVRSEYKIATYDRYLLPSLRYHFSVHNVHQTHLDQLDMTANKFLKKWVGIPSRGCTNLSIFHPHLMNIKTPSQLYLEGHAGNYLSCKLKADSNVQLAIESQLSRESQWTNKTSTIVQCEAIFQQVSEDNLIPTRDNCHNFESSLASQTPILKKAVRQEVQSIYTDIWKDKVQKLVIQGDFIKLLESEQSNVTWKSIIFGVPKGVMAFAMRSATNTLATPDNLKRWKKTASDNCQMCRQPGRPPAKATLHHQLNNCSAFLGEHERYTWRHDSVAQYMAETLKENLPEQMSLYADLEGYKVCGGTIPPTIVQTASRPDIVLIDNCSRTVWLFELTVSFESNMEAANKRKKERYESLAADIEDENFKCNNMPFEIGSRGHISLANKSTLVLMHQLCQPRTKLSQFIKNISKVSLLASYAIYLSRNESNWTSVDLLRPRL